MEKQSKLYSKNYIDSGTNGSKGNVFVGIHNWSTAHSSGDSEPQPLSSESCTIKNSPTSNEHTIQWARAKFDKIFTEAFKTLSDLLTTSDPHYLDSLDLLKADSATTLLHILDNYTEALIEKSRSSDSLLGFCLELFNLWFNKDILASALPRKPTPVLFDQENALHHTFLISTMKIINSGLNLDNALLFDKISLDLLKQAQDKTHKDHETKSGVSFASKSPPSSA